MKLLPFKINGSSLLTLLSGGVSLYFLLVALFHLWGYFRLEERAPATVHQWTIVRKSSSAFAIEAAYTFEAQGQARSGQTVFSKPYHLNTPSAERQIKIFSTRSWAVWYSPKDPAYSSLDKTFPTKKITYALMALGVFAYFLYVRWSLIAKSI